MTTLALNVRMPGKTAVIVGGGTVALRKLHEAWPDAVQTWLAGRDHVGRSEVQALKDELSRASSAPPTPEPESPLPLPLPFLPSVPLSLPVPP